MAENLEYYRNQIVSARTEIKKLRTRLFALKHEHIKEIRNIKSTLNGLRCANCAATATTIVNNHNNDQPLAVGSSSSLTFHPIGVIETSFEKKRGVPRQPSVVSNSRGAIVINTDVFNNPEHAMSGLEEFSHIWIIFHFHATFSSHVPAKVAPPRLGGEKRGVLSTRSPHRPCPIGLSLVKISSIEDNKIYFDGVDMVNGTPVLDIKPYIPQYDCPTLFTTSASLERPPTEGISDAVDGVAALQVANDVFDTRSSTPRVVNPLDIDAESPAHSPYDDASLDQYTNLPNPIASSPVSHTSVDMLDGNLQSRSPLRRPDAERGAPDGQERFTPPQYGVRVASWISNPQSHAYEVRFTEDALERLNDLIGERAQPFKNNIECLLSEDPRSVYVRSRYPDHEYNCVLEDLSISCVFDSVSSLCTIIAVRNADELQQT